MYPYHHMSSVSWTCVRVHCTVTSYELLLETFQLHAGDMFESYTKAVVSDACMYGYNSLQAPPEKGANRESSEQPRAESNSHAAPAAGRKPSRQSLQPQPQQQNTPLKVAARAVHAAAKDRMAVPLNSSTTSLSGRETAKQQRGVKGSTAQHEAWHRSNDSATAARIEATQPLLESSASTERRRARRPTAEATKLESDPQRTRSGRSNKDAASRQVVSDAREPAQQPSRSSRARAQGRASPNADESAQRQSSGRTRRATAVSEKLGEGSSAEQRTQPPKEHAERPNGVRQRPSKASEQAAGSTGARESRAQPKQLLTELVKQAAEFNASPVNKQSPALQPTSRAASRTAGAPRRAAKLAAPPGLEAIVPAAAASRRAAARH